MIGKAGKGKGLAGLARYLQSGRDGKDAERIEWIEGRNLPTNDPETASLLMRATAARSDAIERPVYHIALSFDPGDAVDRAKMVQVADRLLKDLNLRDHQTLIVSHGDTRHAHLHLMVNRVHPKTFRAWVSKNDYARIERSLREQERELGSRPVPGHHYRLHGQAPPDRSETLTTGQLRRWERTGEAPFDELIRAYARRDLLEAVSWKDLDERLGRYGLRLEARGRGLVVTDAQEQRNCRVLRRASRVAAWKSDLERCMENTNSGTEGGGFRNGLRERLNQATQSQRFRARRSRSWPACRTASTKRRPGHLASWKEWPNESPEG